MILVTGATGLSGSAVVREFARQGIPVRALYRDADQARQLDGLPGVELVAGDMLRPESLAAALRGVRRVLLISSARKQMLETQCTFIDAAKAAGVEHIVKFSGKESGVGFDPGSFRGTREHLEIEEYLEGSGLAWTHLRPSQFMQLYLPGSLTGVEMSRPELRLSIGDSRMSPVDVEDIAKVAVALMRSAGHEGRAYEMTGPEALSMKEIVDQISEVTGTTYHYVDIPLETKLAELREARLPEAAVQVAAELLAERRRRPESHIRLETHRLFGVKPTRFIDFVRRNAQAFTGKPTA
ncbi:MAG: SDR family oxidoreductase [Micromonosporaceae bacterium]|nr:SDR family oxidoreductase [Micromonosporaceae bacterium]